jgi:hypothetical protein
VGIRESASDLLIQNCDEYYSYSDLAGLTKEADTPSIQRDPWELVVESVERMARDSDVMRSDRLKQVMQQIDPNFDERNAGFNRFSKFVTEAGNRGLIRVNKLENGQFEVAPVAAADAAAGRVAAPPPSRAPARREPAPAVAEAEENGRRGRRGRRGRGRDRTERVVPREEPAPPAVPVAGPLTLAESFDLMQRALTELRAPVPHDQLRARMVALLGREDELLEPARFSRLLRQANDAEVADVRRAGTDGYEISPHRSQRLARAAAEASGPGAGRAAAGRHAAPVAEPTLEMPIPSQDTAVPEPPASESARTLAGLRFRRGSRGPVRPVDVPLVGVIRLEPEAMPPQEKEKRPARRRGTSPARKTRGERTTKAKSAPAAPPATAEAPTPAKPAARSRRGRSRTARSKEPKAE